MKNIVFWIFLLTFPLLLLGNELPYKPNRIYIGSDVYYQDLQEKYSIPLEIHQHGFLKGYQAGYDFVQKYSFYYGGHVRQNFAKIDEANNKSSNSPPAKNTLENYEGRLGLSFALGNIFATPFGGIGYADWKRKLTKSSDLEYDKLHYKWLYVAYGLRLLIPSSSFDLGFYLTFMQLFYARIQIFENDDISYLQVYENHSPKLDLGKKSHYTIELALSLHPSFIYPLDITFVPYYRDLDIGKGTKGKFFQNQVIYGPSSQTYDIGLRIEAGLRF